MDNGGTKSCYIICNVYDTKFTCEGRKKGMQNVTNYINIRNKKLKQIRKNKIAATNRVWVLCFSLDNGILLRGSYFFIIINKTITKSPLQILCLWQFTIF